MPPIDAFIVRFAVPVAATIVAVLLVRFAGGRVTGVRTAALGLPVGFVAAYAVSPGWPWAPPTDPFDQLAWFALGGALLGTAIDLATRGRVAATMVALVWPALGIAWLGGGALLNTEGSNLYRFGEVSLVLGLVLARLHLISVDGLSGPVTAAVVAAGLAALGLLQGVAGIAAVGLPLAAVGLAWLACNWPVRRFPLGAAGLLGASGTTMVLAGHTALLTSVNASLVLLVLAGVLVQPAVPALAARIPGLGSPAIRPFATALLTALPALLAVALAWLAPGLVPSLY
jgi:hypothetical protein